MNKLVVFAIISMFLPIGAVSLMAQDASSPIVIFSEPGFPAADTDGPAPTRLTAFASQAKTAGAGQLPEALRAPATRLLVLPYGSAFPETSWGAIQSFLDRGGNLLVPGGAPFTRAVYRDSAGWHLRDYSVRFIRPLMIDPYQQTPGSDGLEFQTNPELTLQLPPFAWKRAFSPYSTDSGRLTSPHLMSSPLFMASDYASTHRLPGA